MKCTYSNDPHFLKALHTYWFRYLLAERRPMLNIRIKEIIDEQTKKIIIRHHTYLQEAMAVPITRRDLLESRPLNVFLQQLPIELANG
jgi:hypothetical protein